MYVEGKKGSKIMLIGEAWGEKEAKECKPFVGMAGGVLEGILEEVGLTREDVILTNVIHARPPNNNFKVYYEKVGGKLQPTGELLKAYDRLLEEISQYQPNVIVPLGNEPMKAVLGFDGVTHWRGSVLESCGYKVIPTIHPAAVLRNWRERPGVVCDFKKIVKECETSKINRLDRELIINPSFDRIMQFIEEAKKGEWLSYDIETESGQITCIGLSDRAERAICIPFWWGGSGSLWSVDEESKIWDAVGGLLESDTPKKIAQNGMYDIEFIKRQTGINPKLHFDTMLGFHTLYSELPKALAYLVSIYTDHPYYKEGRKAGNMQEAWEYNAKDACLTLECGIKIHKEVKEAGLMEFYRGRVHALVDPLLAMQERGVLFDVEGKNRLRREIRLKLARLGDRLEQEVGHPLNVNSHPQMTKWLYEELKIDKKFKKRKATGNTTLAADEEALREIYAKHKVPAVKTILEMRELNKIYSTYLGIKLDPDKRIRCSYNITGTETGRLSSSTSTRGTGTNLQNIPSGQVKRMFKASDGMVLINADLSQAEARVVAHLADERRLIDIFNQGGDIHTKNASNIFRCSEAKVTPEQRQMAKRVVHASNYGMGPKTFAKTAGIAMAEAKNLLNQYFATYPRIKQWQLGIKSQLQKARSITTPMGRRRIFFNRWGDSLLKEALAFVPQSTVADIVSEALVNLHHKTKDRDDVHILLQVHDSIVVECNIKDTDEVRDLMVDCMTVPVVIGKSELIIPVDVKVGENWEDMK